MTDFKRDGKRLEGKSVWGGQWRRVAVPFGKLSLLVTGALECSLALLARNLLMASQSFVPEIIHKHV